MIMPKEQKVPSQRTYRTQPYSVPMPGPVLSNNTIMPQPLDHQSPPNERASTAWSQDDDSRLAQYRAKGMNWGPIASHFPNKTPNACRKRHERLMEKQKAESWDGVKTEDLARAYLECREAMWKMVADRVGEKWTTVESKCMEKGLKNLQTAARNRRHSGKGSSPGSHHSDQFEDSALVADGGSHHEGSLPSSRPSSRTYGPSVHDSPYRGVQPHNPIVLPHSSGVPSHGYPMNDYYSGNHFPLTSMSFSPRNTMAHPPILPSSTQPLLPPFQRTSGPSPATSLPGVSNLINNRPISTASY